MIFISFHFPTSLFSEIPLYRPVNDTGVFHAMVRIFPRKSEKSLDKMTSMLYYIVVVRRMEFAAIAQSVERILGKDEVASSNLASSSNSS